ncbi:hypothetical protein ABZ312_24025 [Streptomyces sp. NPDC006207]
MVNGKASFTRTLSSRRTATAKRPTQRMSPSSSRNIRIGESTLSSNSFEVSKP